VSVVQKGGRVPLVEVVSQAGGRLRLANPLGGDDGSARCLRCRPQEARQSWWCRRGKHRLR
jgi:hypothetical protein